MNNFEQYGIDETEFSDALAEAMQLGGATEDEIREQRVAVAVDAAMPDDDPGWTLRRI